MCDRSILDGVLRLVARGDQLPACPSWPKLRDEVAASEMFSADNLEASQEYIMQKFGQLQMEKLQKHMNDMMSKSSPPKSTSNGGSLTSEMPDDDSESESASRDSDMEEDGNLEPTLDEEATDERTRFMSIYLSGSWAGAVLKYCHEERSFVNLRIVKRHRLEVANGQIQMTWKFDGSDESHVTQFLVRETLESDFILGWKCVDEEFNREIATPARKIPGPVTGLFEQPTSPIQGLSQSPTQTWVNSTVPSNVPNTKLIGEIVYHLEVKYRQQDVPDPVPYILPPQTGGIVGEASHSSSSSVRKHGSESGRHSRKSHPKTHRSNSKSTR